MADDDAPTPAATPDHAPLDVAAEEERLKKLEEGIQHARQDEKDDMEAGGKGRILGDPHAPDYQGGEESATG
jgi:hypothetical protein